MPFTPTKVAKPAFDDAFGLTLSRIALDKVIVTAQANSIAR